MEIDRQKLFTIAQTIHEARKGDLGRSTEPEIKGYIRDRNLWDYIATLHGLENLLIYTKQLTSNPLLLDIGAGTTQAMHDLSLNSMGEGLSFMTTGLAKNPDAERLIGKERYKVTPVETLKGIDENSVAGILGVNSIAYSGALEIAARRIDSVLIPGGVIKATFTNPQDGRFFHSHHIFSDGLKSLGYDMEIKTQPGWLDILLAIKPGGIQTTAADLLRADDADMIRQEDVISGRLLFNARVLGISSEG